MVRKSSKNAEALLAAVDELPKKRKKRRRRKEKKPLEPGCMIRVSKGPYYLREDGSKLYTGYKGLFLVMRIYKDYIDAKPKNDPTRHCVIYTGPEVVGFMPRLIRAPHKIEVV